MLLRQLEHITGGYYPLLHSTIEETKMRTTIPAYGNWHKVIPYPEAIATIEWFEANTADHSEGPKVGVYRVSRQGYELVAMGEDDEGCAIGVDSDYVTYKVGQRLLKEGRVYEI